MLYFNIGVAVTCLDDHVPHTENTKWYTHQNVHFKRQHPDSKIYYCIVESALFLSAHFESQNFYSLQNRKNLRFFCSLQGWAIRSACRKQCVSWWRWKVTSRARQSASASSTTSRNTVRRWRGPPHPRQCHAHHHPIWYTIRRRKRPRVTRPCRRRSSRGRPPKPIRRLEK